MNEKVNDELYGHLVRMDENRLTKNITVGLKSCSR